MTLAEGIMAAAMVLQTLYAAATFHRDRRVMSSDAAHTPKRPLIIIAVLMLTTWAAVGFDIYARQSSSTNFDCPELVEGYGVDKGVGYATVNTTLLSEFADSNNLILIMRTSWAGTDKMTDRNIAKSGPYTIQPGTTTAAIVHPHILVTGGENPLEFNIAILPKQFGPDQINTLADVERLGGRILVTRGSTLTLPPPKPKIPTQ